MKRNYAKSTRNRGQEDLFPASGRSYSHVCPGCGGPLTLHDLRDGDQAYWCHACSQGHRAGQTPLAALRREEEVA